MSLWEKKTDCARGVGRTRGLCPITLGHMVTASHSSLLGSLSDAVNHCPDPPAVQALAGKQIASHCSEFFTSFSLQTSYGWTDGRFRGRAGLGFNTVRRHLGPTGGMTKTCATACCLAKDWWTGAHSAYMFPCCSLAPSPPANTKLCG